MLMKRNRKGVFVVLYGIMFLSLMLAAAISIDFSRIWAMRNELQTTADASALAGAVQIGLKPNNSTAQIDSASRRLASLNVAMGDPVTVDDVTLGNWNDNTAAFQPNITPINAVRVVVAHSTNRLIMSNFGILAPRVRANAIAWADAPIAVDNCIKPWSIPYVALMFAINKHRPEYSGSPGSQQNLTRPFDQSADMQALREMTVAERTFDLKLGSGSNGFTDPTISGSTMSGNYQAVVLPKAWDYATQSPVNTSGGGSDYRANIAGTNCNSLSPGDSVMTEPGNKVGPTIQGLEQGVCGVGIGGIPTGNVSNNGDCRNPDGTVGVPVKSAFHLCTTGCSGRTKAAIKMLGSFTLMKAYADNKGAGEQAEIVGVFDPVASPGPVGNVGSTQVKIILVK